MVCYTGKSNQLKPLGDISGVSLSCIAPLSGFFLGDNLVKHIPLTQGKFAIVDDEDYDYLMQWKWFAHCRHGIWYAKSGPKGLMHRLIMNAPAGVEIDHINHIGLDNRKSNLRLCSHTENLQNQRPTKGCSSKYKGVHRHGKKWEARITHNKKRMHIGYCECEIEAAEIYDKKAKELFGEFACCNFGETN